MNGLMKMRFVQLLIPPWILHGTYFNDLTTD